MIIRIQKQLYKHLLGYLEQFVLRYPETAAGIPWGIHPRLPASNQPYRGQ